jgi:hypothetical protein
VDVAAQQGMFFSNMGMFFSVKHVFLDGAKKFFPLLYR